MEKKINVGILFGGRSAEHEVSLQSAKSVYEAIDKEKFNPILIGIDKNGKWLKSDAANYLLNADNPKLIALNKAGESVALLPSSEGKIYSLSRSDNAESIDVVFPVMHGTYAEDGTIQGLLKLADVPFVGPSVLGSAVGMDKDVMKRLLRDAGIPIGKFITVRSGDELPDYETIVEKLGEPFFLKPANMGSSVGVSKVHNRDEYITATTGAFKYDLKIVIEEYIEGREIECAVLGNEDPIASVPGEVAAAGGHEFYSYEAKYIDENGSTLQIPAKISDEEKKEIQEIAIKTFKTLECEGLSRVDSFLTPDGEVIVNEINTIPGFTKISMYPKLFGASGINYSDLITKLIEHAIERYKKEQQLQTSYSDK